MRLSELLQAPEASSNDTGSVRLSTLVAPAQSPSDPMQFDPPGRLDAQALEPETFEAFANTPRSYSVPDLQRQTAPTPDQITQGLLPSDQERQQNAMDAQRYKGNYYKVDDWIAMAPDHVPGESGEHEYRMYLQTHPFPQDAFQQLGPSHQQELLQKFHIKDQGQAPQLTTYQSFGAGMGEGYQGLKKAMAGLDELAHPQPSGPSNQSGPAPGQDLRDSANTELERLSRVQSEPGTAGTAREVARAGTSLIPAALSGPAAPVTFGLQAAGSSMEQTRDVMLQNGINPDDYRGRRILAAVVTGLAQGGAMALGGPGVGNMAAMSAGMGGADVISQMAQGAATGQGNFDPAQSLKAVIQGMVLHYATHSEEIPGVSAAANKIAGAGTKIGQKAAQAATGGRYRPGGGGKWNPFQGEVVDEPTGPQGPHDQPDTYEGSVVPPEQMGSDVANRGNRLPDKPLTSYTVAELRDIASSEGIGIPKTLKKADIVEAIERAQRERAPTQAGEPTNASAVHSDEGQVRQPGAELRSSPDQSSEDIQQSPPQQPSREIQRQPEPAIPAEQTPAQGSRPAGQEQALQPVAAVPVKERATAPAVENSPETPQKPVSGAESVLTRASHGNGIVYVSFDGTGTIPDPEQLRSSLVAQGFDASVVKFHPDAFTGASGNVNFRIDVRGQGESTRLYQHLFGTTEPINNPSEFEKNAPLEQRLHASLKAGAKNDLGNLESQLNNAQADFNAEPEPAGYQDAVKVVEAAGRANIPLLQRKMGIGYHQAKEILDRLQADGKVPSKEAGQQATQDKLGGPSRKYKGARSGMAYMPDLGELRAGVRDLRERYAKIEQDSPRLAYGFTLSQQPNAQAESMISHFEKQAFGGDEQLRQDFYDLGMHYRGDVLNMQGKPATGIPRLSPQSLQMTTSNPRIRRAIDLWNRDIAPVITDIRIRNNLPMSKNADKVPFFFNLPSELEPTSMDRQAINAGLAFSKTATGEGDYMKDPHEGMVSMLRGHLRTDASQIVRDEIRKISIDKATVIDPSGQKNPANFAAPTKGQPFQAKYKGKMIDVAVVDLNKDQVDPVYYPGTKRVWWYPPELHYVPTRVADAWNNLKQDMEKQDTALDKLIHGFTRVALVGDFAPHSLRVLFHVAGRLGQAGNAGTVIPWYGSIPATVVRLVQMKDSQLGQAMQILVDRAGANRGSGYNLRPVKNDLLKYADIPHQLLMNANYGVDPMARRAVANAYLYEEIGQDFMDKIEDRLKNNTISPAAAAAAIQSKLKSKGMLALGRRVNSTLGFSNRQTRKELLNKVQRFLPFLSSQSGMIPGEIRKLLTLNLNPKAVGKAVKRGEYLRALLMVGGALATGAAGTYLMSQGLNRAVTGHDMEDNDERHKADVALGNNWYVSNIDPTFDRASREMALKAQANRESASLPKDAGRELTNEAMATVNPAFRMAFSLATGKAMYLKEDNQLADVRDGWWWPMGAGRGAMSATKEKRGEGFVKDIVQFTTGLRVSKSEGKNYTHAERLATELLAKDSRSLSPEDRDRREARNSAVESIRKNPNVQIGTETGIPEEQFKEVYKEAHMLPVVYKLQHLSTADAMLVWAKMNDQEKREAQPILLEKLANKRTIFKDQSERARLIEQVSSFK